MSNNETIQDVQLSETLKETPVKRIKSYTIMIILYLLFFAFIFFLGSFGGDFFALFVFFIFFSIPILIIFNKQLTNILPSIISDNLLIDEDKDEKDEIKFKASIPKYMKDIAVYLVIALFFVGAIYLLYTVHKELKKPNLPKEAFKNFELIGQYKIDSKKISMKILGAVICTCIAGVTLLDIETAKYSAGQEGGDTPGAEATTDKDTYSV